MPKSASSNVKSDLLASLMRAMAMRSLFLRKMSSRMMMTSTMARIITKREREGEGDVIWVSQFSGSMSESVKMEIVCWVLTEGQPGLSDLQVD